MIELPDPGRAFDWENAFYLSAKPERFGKLIAQYELFQRVLGLPGAVVECGVFKGASLCRWAGFREILGNSYAKPIVGFDTFCQFQAEDNWRDGALRDAVVRNAGSECITVEQLRGVLNHKGCGGDVDLVAGDICKTVPEYVAARPELKVSLLNIDVDFYPAARTALEYFYPRMVKGGIVLLDDYGVFPGETKAADEFFEGRAEIKKFPYAYSPCYVEV